VGAILPSNILFLDWPAKSLIVILATIPLLLALTYVVRRTRQGKAMRAVAQDMDAARMMGVDVDRTISFTFALAGILAGAGGTLYVLEITTTRYDLGQIGLLAFTAAVLGGIGNLTGATLGALIIGLIQAFNEGLSWHAPGEQWTTSIVFSILILILVFRPQGLLGQPEADRAMIDKLADTALGAARRSSRSSSCRWSCSTRVLHVARHQPADPDAEHGRRR
jgi:branched-chain amino acid transport system permease protein